MSQANIRKAFEKAVIAFNNNVKTNIAFENVQFTPVSGQFYFLLRLIPLDVQNPTLGDNYHREVGVYQIVLCFPSGNGGVQAASKAEEIKSYFKRATTLVEGDTEVIVDKTPSIGAGYIEGSRYCIPIRISYYTNEF